MNVVVYCGSNPGNNTNYAKAALELGAWIGDSGNTLVYGGSSVGLMGLISRVVLEHGGEVYGVEPQFFIDAGVEQQDLTELYVVENMSERKAKISWHFRGALARSKRSRRSCHAFVCT